MNSVQKALHEQAVSIAKQFHQSESALIDILQKIDQAKVFASLGFSSLFDYAVKALKLSEANSSNFITVARKSNSVPELKIAIQKGDLTVSKARKITSVLTKENSAHWLELAKTLPKLKLEKEVAKVNPKAATPERIKYATENRLEVKLGLSEEAVGKLKRAQDLVSQKTKRAANIEDTLEELLEFYLQKQDPLEKAKRNGSHLVTETDTAASVPGTRYIPTKIKHQVHLRDQGHCRFIDVNGNRCENKRWIEIHHKDLLSHGGANSLANLTTLCSAHHRWQHIEG